jgi:hypothetical protein
MQNPAPTLDRYDLAPQPDEPGRDVVGQSGGARRWTSMRGSGGIAPSSAIIRLRLRTWTLLADKRTLLGLSDAGAHAS